MKKGQVVYIAFITEGRVTISEAVVVGLTEGNARIRSNDGPLTNYARAYFDTLYSETPAEAVALLKARLEAEKRKGELITQGAERDLDVLRRVQP